MESVDSSNVDFVLVCGYGRVGKMICDLLDRKFIRYIAIESNLVRAEDAKSKGLPVFYADINQPGGSLTPYLLTYSPTHSLYWILSKPLSLLHITRSLNLSLTDSLRNIQYI